MKSNTIFDEFGSLIFSDKVMKERLPSPILSKWKKTMANEETLDRPTADAIAHAMKTWALELGATHYTHWFAPMTTSTAEKHDAFIEPDEKGEPILRFSGKSLIKGEPDASSFPHGGLRATFEARGYTYWDCSSYAFIKDNILCIPSIFVSYNGEALDKKAPLLKSITAIDESSTKLLHLLGETNVKHVSPVVGLEQEYFLIDEQLGKRRLDLCFTGRTLFGSNAVKTQDLEEHYFGSIPQRISDFMKDVNEKLWKWGIYAKAEHNESAPAQFELAPVFTSCNIAVDQNQLIMDTLKHTAEKHHLMCLLHEKPFKGINGSGKHNNYSLLSDNGINCFAIDKNSNDNIRFLAFVTSFIKAVDDYPELLRLSSSNAGNDHRLGGHEAPPAIISIFLGSHVENLLLQLIDENSELETTQLFSPISSLSYIPRDNTDRNRTSPMAFTGNKFEFRMLGSSMSAAEVNTVLNSILAASINELLEQCTTKEDVIDYCKKTIKKHRRILFSKDGYSEEWVLEAKQRGLPNIKSYIEATTALIDQKSIDLFSSLGVYTKKELDARYEIINEQYCKTMEIEVRTLLQMVKREILPCLINELQQISAIQLPQLPQYILHRNEQLCYYTDTIHQLVEQLITTFDGCTTIKCDHEKGLRIASDIIPIMNQLRTVIDDYEKISSKQLYPLPLYGEMLFSND